MEDHKISPNLTDNYLNELSQNPQARMNLLSTVTTKHEWRMFTFWLKLSPR